VGKAGHNHNIIEKHLGQADKDEIGPADKAEKSKN
jgi:hypothetical protein